MLSSGELRVKADRDGEIVLPAIGRVPAAGYTSRQLADTLALRYRNWIRGPVFEVSVTSLKIRVLGSTVIQGVVLPDREFLTLAEVLTRSGGIRYTEAGNIVQILRGDGSGRQTITFTFDQLADPLILNQPVFGDDIVYVPPSPGALRSVRSQRSQSVIQPLLTALNLAVIGLNIVRLIK